jgi:hypothetical protein
VATSSLVLLPVTWKLHKCARYIMSSRKPALSPVTVSLNSAVDGAVSPSRFALSPYELYGIQVSIFQAARTYGCEVDTLTLSIEQKTLAEELIRAAGLEGRIRVHLLDYREIPAEFEKAFDAFISVEMLEVALFHSNATTRSLYFLSARWRQTLQYVFQACRLRSQISRCSGCCFFLDFPGVALHQFPVSR